MAEVVGYLDRWSARPGARIGVHLAGSVPARARVDLVRLGRGTHRDEPGGIAYEPVPEVEARDVVLLPQPVDEGSYAEIDLGVLALDQGCLGLLVQPWAPTGEAEQVVAVLGQGSSRLAVVVTGEGVPALRAGAVLVPTEFRAGPRRWLVVALSWTQRAATLTVLDPQAGVARSTRVERHPASEALTGTLLLAGAPSEAEPGGRRTVHSHFDGRLERPLLWPAPQPIESVRDALVCGEGLPRGALAAWDFSPSVAADAPQDLVPDLGAHALHGRLRQGPRRAVRGMRWTGQFLDWRDAPSQYAAVHFHRDDLEDAGWPCTLEIVLPDALPSGAYAVRVRGNAMRPAGDDPTDPFDLTAGQCRLPLFVRAPADGPVPPGTVALVFPTFTYLAYANDRCALHGHNPEVLADRAIALEATDVLLSRHPEWGLSLYDTHHDGSGVGTASRRRPIPTLQPDARAWQAGEGSGRWNYPGDLLLVEWIEREGIPWHALTDEDVHADGAAALSAYRVVLTGNHPEYATPALLRAFRDHLDGGGRLMYLGGNGFYWRIACHPQRPGVIELRRAEDGNRSWAEEPCEYFHAFDGGYGGLWRRSGITPQSWLGVGYAGQGFRRSTGLRRARDAHRPDVAFVFDGVPEGDFGLQGAIGGGCAGIEVDRRDELLGSDPAGWWLATSLPLDATYLAANEEMLVSRPTIAAPFTPAVRADMVLQPVPGGGAVFASGSIAWIGGLSADQGDAAVQRITRNVLSRLLDPAPLAAEPGPWLERLP